MKRKPILIRRCLVLLLLLAFTLTAVIAAGCQDQPPSGAPTRLKFIRIGNDAAEAAYWKRLIADFNAVNKDLIVEYDDAAIGEAMESKLNSAFGAGIGPDIIGHGIISVAARVEAGHYQKITALFDKWEGKNDILPRVLENGRYKGEIYGLGYSTTPFVFAWRKDLFQAAGLDPETPPKNWAELEAFARKLTVKDGGQITQSGFAFPRSAGNFVEFDTLAFGNGGRFFDKDGKPTLNTPQNAETLKFLAGFVGDVSVAYGATDTNPFVAGRAAMTLINNVALTPMMNNEQFKGKVAIALPPYQTEPASFAGCNMLFIGKDNKKPEQAFRYIAFALSKEETLRRAKELAIPVTRQSQVDAFSALDPFNAVRAECVAKGIGMPRTTWSTKFQSLRNNLVQQVLYAKASPEAALADAQKQLEAEIAAVK